MQELLPQIKDRGATLWAISADTLADSQALAQKLKLEYPVAADPELRAIRSYGVEMAGTPIAVPATFVLRPGDGEIVYRYVGETLFDRPAQAAILAALDAANKQANKTATAPEASRVSTPVPESQLSTP